MQVQPQLVEEIAAKVDSAAEEANNMQKGLAETLTQVRSFDQVVGRLQAQSMQVKALLSHFENMEEGMQELVFERKAFGSKVKHVTEGLREFQKYTEESHGGGK